MIVTRTRAELAAARAELVAPVGLVPTMGALHAGHAALLGVARADCVSVVASIFVNPLQFGAGEDLDRYPRSLTADLAMCERAGVDVVWAPSVGDVYPRGTPQVTVSPGPRADELEGAARPGSFRRGADRGREALRPGPTGRRLLRREGLPAAGAGTAKCPLTLNWASRSSPCRPCATRTASRSPAGTSISRQPTGSRPLGSPVACEPGSRPRQRVRMRCLRRPGPRSAPRLVVDYLALRGARPRMPCRTTARRACWSPSQVGQTRLIDNVEVIL